MAAKRIAQSAVDWAALAERVPPNQKHFLTAFKTKSDGYLRRVLANPEAPPKLDWNYYKKNVAVAGMADNFQKQYEALKVPFPVDNKTAEIDAQQKEVEQEIKAYISASNARIAEYEKELSHWKAMLPFDQMTMEDYRDAFPNDAMDPINRPTFWPHGPEDQVKPKPEAH